MGPMSESQSSSRLSLLRFLSLGAVKIMDCHAKWPDTRGQKGCLGGGGGKEGVIVGVGFGGCLKGQGGGQIDESGMLPSQFILY